MTAVETTGIQQCCLSGMLQTGQPQGHVEEIAGRTTYVAVPEGRSKSKAVVFLCDIFGYTLTNTRLLADNYAKAGFYAYVPDIHDGDDMPEEFLQVVEPPLKDREQLTLTQKAANMAKGTAEGGPWMFRHREAIIKPIIDGFINDVKKIPGTEKVGAIGFCHGGRYAILAAHGLVDAAYACHPSLVSIPADLNSVTKPLSLANGDKDGMVPVSESKKMKEVLDKISDVPTEVELYEDQVHGFALRGDWSSNKDKKAMDAAEKQGIDWFNKYLS